MTDPYGSPPHYESIREELEEKLQDDLEAERTEIEESFMAQMKMELKKEILDDMAKQREAMKAALRHEMEEELKKQLIGELVEEETGLKAEMKEQLRQCWEREIRDLKRRKVEALFLHRPGTKISRKSEKEIMETIYRCTTIFQNQTGRSDLEMLQSWHSALRGSTPAWAPTMSTSWDLGISQSLRDAMMPESMVRLEVITVFEARFKQLVWDMRYLAHLAGDGTIRSMYRFTGLHDWIDMVKYCLDIIYYMEGDGHITHPSKIQIVENSIYQLCMEREEEANRIAKEKGHKLANQTSKIIDFSKPAERWSIPDYWRCWRDCRL